MLSRPTFVGIVTFAALTILGFSHSIDADDDHLSEAVADHQSATFKRILANWKARQERAKSLHFTWERDWANRSARAIVDLTGSRTDVISDLIRRSLNEPAGLWMNSNGCFRYEHVPTTAIGAEFDFRSVGTFDGATHATAFDRRSLLDTTACVPRNLKDDPGLADLEFVPVLLTLRPLHESSGWSSTCCRLVTEHAIVDGIHYVRIDRSDPKTSVVDTCYVDPRRDDIVVRWRRSIQGARVAAISIDYQRKSTFGYVPSGWKTEWFGGGLEPLTRQTVVTCCDLNAEIPSERFSPDFPPGSIVVDDLRNEPYYVRSDGSKHRIAERELRKGIKFFGLMFEDRTSTAPRK